jgi:hypothetical protein
LHHRLLRAAAHMTMARQRLALASWLGVLMGLSSEAFADATAASAAARVHLTTARGPGAQRCIPAELEAAVEARLGRSVFDAAPAADLIIEVQAGKRGREFVIDLRLFDRNRRRLGQRRLTTRARHCSALDDSLALVLSLAADVTRASLQPPEAERAPAPPTALETPLEIPAATLAPREELRVRPALGVNLGVGLLPQASASVEAGLTLVFPHFWPLSLRAALWHDQRLGVESGIDFSLQTLQLGICPATLEAAAIEVSFCVEQLLGRVHVSGFGFDQADASDHWLAAFGAGVVLRYWIGRAFVSVQGSLLVPAVQRRYYVQDGERVVLHESAWVLGMAGLAAGFEL